MAFSGFELPPVSLDGVPDDGEPESGPVGSGREATFEDGFPMSLGNARTVVGNVESVWQCPDPDCYVVASVFDAVLNEVFDDLSQSVNVGIELYVVFDR